MNEKYNIELPKENEVKRIEVSDIFYVEVINSYDHEDLIEFWLCMKHHGLKDFIIGLQKKDLINDPFMIRSICTREWIETARDMFRIDEILEELED